MNGEILKAEGGELKMLIDIVSVQRAQGLQTGAVKFRKITSYTTDEGKEVAFIIIKRFRIKNPSSFPRQAQKALIKSAARSATMYVGACV